MDLAREVVYDTQEKALKLYDECLARRFPGSTLVEAPASKIIELPSEAPSPQVQSGPSKMNVDPPLVINMSILGSQPKLMIWFLWETLRTGA